MAKIKKTKNTNRDISDPNTLTGRHIYKDDKGRTLYYQERSMTGYVIKAENVAKYRQYSSRALYGILAGVVTATVFNDMNLPIYLGIIIGVGFWGVLSMRFYKNFLPQLIQVKNFIPTEKATMIQSLSRTPKNRLILKTILLVVFAILLVVNATIYEKPDIYLLGATALAAVGSIVYAGVLLFTLRYQAQQDK